MIKAEREGNGETRQRGNKKAAHLFHFNYQNLSNYSVCRTETLVNQLTCQFVNLYSLYQLYQPYQLFNLTKRPRFNYAQRFEQVPSTSLRTRQLFNRHFEGNSCLGNPHHCFYAFYGLIHFHSIFTQFLLHGRLGSVFFNTAEDHFQHIMRFGILP